MTEQTSSITAKAPITSKKKASLESTQTPKSVEMSPEAKDFEKLGQDITAALEKAHEISIKLKEQLNNLSDQ